MKFNIKRVLILTSLGIIFALLITYSSNNTSNKQENNENTLDIQDDSNLKRPKISGAYTESFIHIDGNWSDAIGKGWFKGDGSWENPYAIENVTIDASSSPTGSGIFIENSKNEIFVIRNCTIYNAGNGIMLENTNNGTLTGNTADDNNRGIYLYNNCDNNTISGNFACYNDYDGIYLYNDCDNNIISGNTARDNLEHGIYLYNDCDGNTISKNTADGNPEGISLEDYCDNNNISGNKAKYNYWYGIYLNNDCDGNTISGNTARDHYLYGIYLNNDCDGNTISGNKAYYNGEIGIYLYQDCDDNTLLGNTANYNGDQGTGNGIFLYQDCDGNTISGNTASGNGDLGFGNGIFLYQDCDGNIISGNNADINEEYGIYLYDDCDGNTISGNIADYNWWYGIYLYDDCDDNTLLGNTAYYNFYVGMCLETGCDNNTLSGNTANYNEAYGIFLYNNCDNNTLSGNSANNNGIDIVGEGIYLYKNCDGNIISGNTANSNKYYGIRLRNDCDGKIISGNTANNNGEIGILINPCDGIIISGNTANNNGLDGIRLIGGQGNIMSGNTANNNGEIGIRLNGGQGNIMSGNNANDNSHGISLSNDCDGNIIFDNAVKNNKIFGIKIEINCDNNLIYFNIFIGNGENALDNGDNNQWDNGNIGNYWDDYLGLDADDDGIGDTPYEIPGSAASLDNFPYFGPKINIKSPIMGQIFGQYSPIFEIQTAEFWPCIYWYSIDGGLTNIPFTKTVGIIDQNNWSATPNGHIFLRFYIRDIIGNEAFKEVIMIKDAEEEVEDPIIPIITINAPTMNQEFGKYSLGFDISIEGSDIASMWYTLDGGLTNTTFTELIGTINQEIWSAQPNGLITIRFYAEDIEGDIGYADVIVIKNVEDEVEDPITPIITINAPIMNQEFGKYSLGFDISIEGSTVISMWYTLDGGHTNTTFTELIGIIDQDLWLAQPKGLITIRFYAKDTEGDIGYADVIVIKNVGKKDIHKAEINTNDQTFSEPSANQLLLLFGGISTIGGMILMPLIRKKIFK